MNEGTIKEIKLEDGKAFVKINMDLKHEKKENDKVIESYNIYIIENETAKNALAVMFDSNMFLEIDIQNIGCLLNKKCIFEFEIEGCSIEENHYSIDIPVTRDKVRLKSITIKAPN